MKRIALFGGSFDPIHTDHVNIIKTCKEKLGFEEVWIVPSYVNPFKTVSTSSVSQRLKMIKIATKDLKYVKIIDYEILRPQKSFTYNTVIYLKNEFSDITFSFIIGSDQLDNFEKWDHFDDLIKEVDFKVFLRSEEYNKKIIQKYNLETFEFNNNFLSSSDIRVLKKLELQIPEINDYINSNLMYIEERMATQMDEKRFLHCLNVGQMAVELARLNNIDINKALVAGVLHDLSKRWEKPKMIRYLEKYNSLLLSEPEPVWHGFVAAYSIKHDWLIDDIDIFNAIFKHTVADEKMSTLDMIIFCADKISIERNYDGVDNFRKLVKNDLKLGFITLLKQQYEFAVKKNGIESIGTMLKNAYDYWVVKGGESYE